MRISSHTTSCSSKTKLLHFVLLSICFYSIHINASSIAFGNDIPFEVLQKGHNVIAVMKNGDVLGVGPNGDFELCIDQRDIKKWRRIRQNTANVFSSSGATIFLDKANDLWICGSRFADYFSDNTQGEPGDHIGPVKILNGVSKIAHEPEHALVLMKNGTLNYWGKASYYPGLPPDGPQPWPLPFGSLQSVKVDSSNNAVLEVNGDLWVWKRNDEPKKLLTQVDSFDFIYGTLIALKKDGTLWGYGDNADGAGGVFQDPPEEEKSSVVDLALPEELEEPVQIMDNVVSFSFDGQFGLARKKDGWLWGWGDRRALQCQFPDIGNNKDTALEYVYVLDRLSHAKVDVQGLRPSRLVRGYTPLNNKFILKDDGTVWIWENNPAASPPVPPQYQYQVDNGSYPKCLLRKIQIKEGAKFPGFKQ